MVHVCDCVAFKTICFEKNMFPNKIEMKEEEEEKIVRVPQSDSIKRQITIENNFTQPLITIRWTTEVICVYNEEFFYWRYAKWVKKNSTTKFIDFYGMFRFFSSSIFHRMIRFITITKNISLPSCKMKTTTTTFNPEVRLAKLPMEKKRKITETPTNRCGQHYLKAAKVEQMLCRQIGSKVEHCSVTHR